jgi:hypothetical protein
MALLSNPSNASTNGATMGMLGGLSIQQLQALLAMLKKKKALGSATGAAGDSMASPTQALGQAGGIQTQMPSMPGATASIGQTRPPGAPSYADLVNPTINKAMTPGAMGSSPFGREDAGGNLTSQFLPPGEGAVPSNDQSDILAAILSALGGMRGGTGLGGR